MRDRFRVPMGGRMYYPTGRDFSIGEGRNEEAYWVFSKQVGDKFGETGATVGEIYKGVSGPLGLTLDNTKVLVQGSVERGYLR